MRAHTKPCLCQIVCVYVCVCVLNIQACGDMRAHTKSCLCQIVCTCMNKTCGTLCTLQECARNEINAL